MWSGKTLWTLGILVFLSFNAWSYDTKPLREDACEYEFINTEHHRKHRLCRHREDKEPHHFRDSIKQMAASVKLFLNASANGPHHQLDEALGEWENQLVFADYYEHMEPERANVLTVVPMAAWHLLKNILFTVGIRLPKATLRTTKAIVHATYDCLKV